MAGVHMVNAVVPSVRNHTEKASRVKQLLISLVITNKYLVTLYYYKQKYHLVAKKFHLTVAVKR